MILLSLASGPAVADAEPDLFALLSQGYEIKAAFPSRLGDVLFLQRGTVAYRCAYMIVSDAPIAVTAKCARISRPE